MYFELCFSLVPRPSVILYRVYRFESIMKRLGTRLLYFTLSYLIIMMIDDHDNFV